MTEKYTVTAMFDGTADDVLRAAGFSRSLITELRKSLGLIRVKAKEDKSDGKAVFATARVNAGDEISVTLPVTPCLYPASDIKPEFSYIDEDIAVVIKPSGVATVPVKSHYKDSLASVLASEWGEFVYRPVGRLDKETSGLIIVARNALAASRMHEIQLKGEIDKRYTALTDGIIPERGIIDAPIALSSDGLHREVSEKGKEAKTIFKRLSVKDNRSLVEFRLLTGRTHQIRVHSSYIGYPLSGDKLYNPHPDSAPRLMLHCSRLEFFHPTTGKTIICESPFSPDV